MMELFKHSMFKTFNSVRVKRVIRRFTRVNGKFPHNVLNSLIGFGVRNLKLWNFYYQ